MFVKITFMLTQHQRRPKARRLQQDDGSQATASKASAVLSGRKKSSEYLGLMSVHGYQCL